MNEHAFHLRKFNIFPKPKIITQKISFLLKALLLYSVNLINYFLKSNQQTWLSAIKAKIEYIVSYIYINKSMK